MRQRSTLFFAAVFGVVALCAATAAFALGTPAGTVITNTATVNYQDVNGNPLTASASVSTTVSQVASVDISPATQAASADPGDQVCYAHTVTNNGNGTDVIDVTSASSQGWTVTFYQDNAPVGTFDPGDTPLVDNGGAPAVDTGSLTANGQRTILVCVQVPAGTADGTVDNTTATVTSSFDNGQTDSATDTTTINAPNLSVSKTVAPPGNQPPGTVLTYTITISNNGSATASSVQLTDPIPASTTYQAGTIVRDSVAQTDANDPPTDNSQYDSGGNRVVVDVGTLAPGDSTTVVFSVQIQ
ncbi:MAG TPA: hypothetical protein VJS92_15435 [Candidatus Polarisedimenticolaceae bacterium]|nr:hypothetical protein [Candidatus Polarisedimenticolaceae bacterium]